MEASGGNLGIIGASGFIGGVLTDHAVTRGWSVVGFSRRAQDPDGSVSEWRQWSDRPDVSGLDALVNLAGESIAQRWSEKNRVLFRESRVGVTEILARAISESGRGPSVLVNGSAVGIYGDRGDERLSERANGGGGYLAELCADWEHAALPLRQRGVVVSLLRTGIVLGRGGEAWERMRKVFSLGLGGRFGSGRQWMPWIHVDDLAGAILHAVENGLDGPLNGVAPEPERNEDFTRKLAQALNRPAFFHAPGWGLKLGLGEFGGALLAGQRAVPEVLLESGYRFRFPTLDSALAELC